MADNTPIEWADATVNAVNGCSVISPGCTNCYAMRLAGTRMKHHPSRAGLTQDSKAGPVWTGEVRLHEPALRQPLAWKRPRRIFWNAHGDLFHEAVPDEWIDRVFAVCALTPQHQHMILTKRAGRMREYVTPVGQPQHAEVVARVWEEAHSLVIDGAASHHSLETEQLYEGEGWPLPNVWLGVSVEDQARADERREDLASTPAAIKFVSYEPALGPVDWTGWEFVDQIISGGESGPKARPSHPDWHRATRDFCGANDIAYFFKQWGEWAESSPDASLPMKAMNRRGVCDPKEAGVVVYRLGKKRAGRLLDGREWSEFPAAEGGRA